MTGCSSGLGQVLDRYEFRSGPPGYCPATARDVALLSYIPDKLRVLKPKLDVTSRNDIVHALFTAVEIFERLDMVINNAGYMIREKPSPSRRRTLGHKWKPFSRTDVYHSGGYSHTPRGKFPKSRGYHGPDFIHRCTNNIPAQFILPCQVSYVRSRSAPS